ncbi:hypothetical protein TNCV_3534281 [Trichonephila clavipes]|nr:hypothetical protein TNCV_3534281 [Trichonephila clavipes]
MSVAIAEPPNKETKDGNSFLDILGFWMMPKLQNDEDNFIFQLYDGHHTGQMTSKIASANIFLTDGLDEEPTTTFDWSNVHP